MGMVGNPSPDTASGLGRNRLNQLSPRPKAFSPLEEQRIEKDGAIPLTRLEGGQIQDPPAPSETKPQTVGQENQIAWRVVPGIGTSDKPLKRTPKAVTQGLACERGLSSLGQPFQVLLAQEDPLEKTGAYPPGGPPTFLWAKGPCVKALAALTAFLSKTINFGATTGGFRMYCFHTYELFSSRGPNLLQFQVDT